MEKRRGKWKVRHCAACDAEFEGHWDGLCDKCWSYLERGKRISERIEGMTNTEDEIVSVGINRLLDPPSYKLAEREGLNGLREAPEEFWRLLGKLADFQVVWRQDAQNFLLDEPEVTFPGAERWNTSLGDAKAVTLRRRKLETFRQLVVAMSRYARAIYEDGYSSGSSLLLRIASGELTVAEMEENETRRK